MFCVVKYRLFFVVIGTGILDLDVEILLVATVVILLLILDSISILHTRKQITRFILKQFLAIKISIIPRTKTITNIVKQIVKLWFNK